MTKLCTYIVSNDKGLAPNPFWGWCTLAVCTPNHMGARLVEGDWIAGFLSKSRQHRFLYAMEIENVLHMGDYYKDKRFLKKRPNLRGSWKKRCGDNFYELTAAGVFKQHWNRFHLGGEYLKKDTRYPRVFAAQRFWYLGQAAISAPDQFAPLIPGRGIRVNHDPRLAAEFICWVKSSFKEGISGEPNDNPDFDVNPLSC